MMWLRSIVVLSGVVVFVLLLFADKTNLSNKLDAAIEGTVSSSSNTGLPPLAPDEELTRLLDQIEQSEGEEKIDLLDTVIQSLVLRNRLAYAANYAQEKANLSDDYLSTFQAGQLSYEATQLDYIQSDSIQIKRYFDQAISNLEKAVELKPLDEEANLFLGLAYVNSGEISNSMRGIQTIRKVLEINPNNVQASFHLGMFSMKTNQFEKAIQRFEKVLELDSGNELALFTLAQALSATGKTEKAKEKLNELLTLKPSPEISLAAKELLNNF